MRKTFLLVSVFFVFLLNVEDVIAANVPQKETTDSILVSIGDINLVLWGVPKENFSEYFNLTIGKDTIFLERLFHEGIENLQIQFLNGPPNGNFLKGEVIYGIRQWLIGAEGRDVLLRFSFKDSIHFFEIDGKYSIFSAMRDCELVDSILEHNYFQEIKKESYIVQKNFYQYFIENKAWEECCPEYIEQAKRFLSQKESDFKTLTDLALWVDYKTVILALGENKYFVFDNVGNFGEDAVREFWSTEK